MEKYNCECGSIITNNKRNIEMHKLTEKHTKYMREMQNEQKINKLRKIKDKEFIKANNGHYNNIINLFSAYEHLSFNGDTYDYSMNILNSAIRQKLRFLKCKYLNEDQINNIKSICTKCDIEYDIPIFENIENIVDEINTDNEIIMANIPKSVDLIDLIDL